MTRSLRWGALACAVCVAPVWAQLREAQEAPATVLGRVCEDLDADGRCGPGDPPIPGLVVRTAQGLSAVTDVDGRFHLTDAGRRVTAETAGELRFERLPHVAITVDPTPLGPGAVAPAPVWVDLAPGSLAQVELPVRLPDRPPLAPVRAGVAVGSPRTRADGDALVYLVPVRVAPGDRVRADGVPVPVDEEGRASIPVPAAGREQAVTLTVRSPDGTLRILYQVVLRVPRRSGGDLIVPRPIAHLGTVTLPPEDAPVAPGRLRVRLKAEAGTLVSFGDEEPSAAGGAPESRWVTVPQAGPLTIRLSPPGGPSVQVEAPLVVTPSAGNRWLLAADLRGGAGAGIFADARLAALGRVHLAGGLLTTGLDLTDAEIAEAVDGGGLLQVRRPAVARWPDPETAGAVFGDASVTTAANPAGLTVYGDWTGPAGRAGLGAARTGLTVGEVGRFDRPVVGPYVDLQMALGPLSLHLAGAVDASGLPLAEHTGWAPGHAVLAATGGALYWLPRRDLVPGSERLWVESQDPFTGLAAARRALVRGVDYEIDYLSGRVLLAAPLGDAGRPPVGRLSAAGLGFESRLVADYASHLAPGEADPALASGAVRGAITAGPVELGLRGATVNAGRYGLLGVDATASPFPWLSVTASAAASEGAPFRGDRALAWSGDGGLSWRPESVGLDAAGTGFSVRARAGDSRNGLTAWWVEREAGFADGTAVEGPVRQRGALGRSDLGPVRLSILANERRGLQPGPDPSDLGVEASGLDLGGRLETDLGPLTVALEGLHRRLSIAGLEGTATAAGAEAAFRISERLVLLAGHLQGLDRAGEGPGARDPTFTSVGLRASGPALGTVAVRGGLHADGTPAVDARWAQPAEGGRATYGTFAVRADGPWTRQGVASVSGAREVVAPGVMVFAEERTVEDPFEGPRAGTAMGGELAEGPWRLSASWERGLRLLDGPDALRDAVHGRVGYLAARWSATGFGEVVRTPPTLGSGFVRRWSAGAALNARLTDTLSVGGRVLASDAPVLSGPALDPAWAPQVGLPPAVEVFAGAAWRPRAAWAPAVLLHYGLRQDGTGNATPLFGDPHRRHVLRVAAAVGDVGGFDLRLTLLGAVDERLQPEPRPDPAWAGVASVRAGGLLFGRLEPAVEVGVRRVGGAVLGPVVDATARVELLLVLGALRLGAGATFAGFAGTGLEPVTGSGDPPQVYAVIRGAL